MSSLSKLMARMSRLESESDIDSSSSEMDLEFAEQNPAMLYGDYDDADEDAVFAAFEADRGVRSRGALVPRERVDWEQHVQRLRREGSFARFYRMSEDTFDKLVDSLRLDLKVDADMAKLRNGAVTPEMQVSMTLRRLAGGSYEDIRTWHGIARPTFYAVYDRIIAAINRHPDTGVMLWPSEEGCVKNAAAFAARSGPPCRLVPLFLHVIGAIDGIFIKTRVRRSWQILFWQQAARWTERASGLRCRLEVHRHVGEVPRRSERPRCLPHKRHTSSTSRAHSSRVPSARRCRLRVLEQAAHSVSWSGPHRRARRLQLLSEPAAHQSRAVFWAACGPLGHALAAAEAAAEQTDTSAARDFQASQLLSGQKRHAGF